MNQIFLVKIHVPLSANLIKFFRSTTFHHTPNATPQSRNMQ